MGGGTSASLAVHTWQLEADDMAAAITDAQAGPVDVVAGSNGCSLGLRLTLDHPDLVRTLVLCWPAAPHRREGAAAFINLAKRVEADGPRVLGTADAADAAGRTAGVAPWEAAAGDERFHESLAEFDNVTAAAVVRESAAALFAGDLIRGVDESESATIADSGRAVWVIPSEHFDHWHDEATFDAVMRAIPGCRRGPAMPESPTSRFASARDRFAEFVGSVLSRD
jgi:pimeloyl-ACP methyl ester carboxylesterase